MGPTNAWAIYLQSADIDATCSATEANGGSVRLPPMDVGELGRMAYVAGPDGASIGVWQPGEHPGFLTIDAANAPAWFELHTNDYEGAVDFYRAVFGWDTHVMSDTPDFHYTTYGEGDDARAGIMDSAGHLGEGEAPYWSLYFGVADTDAALVTVEELGGSVLMGAEDTPYGRLASVADATGARFMLVSPR
jgi:predicted enzyme related to lactoylglutathione lyase